MREAIGGTVFRLAKRRRYYLNIMSVVSDEDAEDATSFPVSTSYLYLR